MIIYSITISCTHRRPRRAEYHNDVVLDIVGYRKNGHNEMDEPMLTQPLMYKRIRDHPNVLAVYTERLVSEGLLDEASVKQVRQTFSSLFLPSRRYQDNTRVVSFQELIRLTFQIARSTFLTFQEIDKYQSYCESEFEKAKGISSMQMADWHDVPWTDFFSGQSPANPIPPTGLPAEDIEAICAHICTPPANIKPHQMVSLVLLIALRGADKLDMTR